MKRLSLVLAALLATGALHAQTPATAEKLFASARHQETTQGDLRAAIETYRKVVAQAGANRALAAQALLRMAECHTKLGDVQARQAYERLVREFGDMPEASTARARIGTAGTAIAEAAVAIDRIVKAGEDITWGDGRVSPDGRYISYTDFSGSGNLMLHDLVSGAERALTGNKDGAWRPGSSYGSTFSPDGKSVAYGWRTYRQAPALNENELRIAVVDAPPGTQARTVHADAEIEFYDAMDWSRDGRWIAVLATRRDRTAQIALVGAKDGSFRSLKTVGWRGPRKMFFSPDGKHLAYDLPSSDTATNRDVFVMATDGSRDTAIVDHAAQDVVMGWSPDGKQLLYASDRSGVVGLWSMPVADGRSAGAPTLVKKEIGSIQSLGLTAAGTLHIVKDTSTLSLQLAPFDRAARRLAGPPVLENFRSARPSWSRDGKRLAYVVTRFDGVRSIAVRDLETGRIREIPMALDYLFEPAWLADGQSLVVFGRDFKGKGGIHRVDVTRGTSLLVAASDASRVKVSSDGNSIFHQIGRATLGPAESARLVQHDLATGASREVRRGDGIGGDLSPDGRLLAAISPSSDGKTSTLVLAPIAADEPVRRVELRDRFFERVTWLPDGKAVVASKRGSGLWAVPIDGSAPTRLDIDIRDWSIEEGIRFDPSGTHIAFFTGKNGREVWALESLATGSR
ncbi:hypothetical protein TBR22_A00410 [Luteitalea sp. TBR-22]|uniref:tetratricopeptide repeat protein n=1 Tax=Luteitalea sp. TBR-22 TaxID=2802971 RepID=UPI001AF183A5|nr:tetratricopeptide repeat protein [Luteitalea sp. TBR-22]BCS30841.1 hypothetical protein TBR22_A00410 [Luteitalea sp. TBR-22]